MTEHANKAAVEGQSVPKDIQKSDEDTGEHWPVKTSSSLAVQDV